MRLGRRFWFAAAAVFGVAMEVSAEPITYTFEFSNNGSLDGVAFADALVTLTLTGDTDDVMTDPNGALFIAGLPVDFEIEGVASGSFISSGQVSLVPYVGLVRLIALPFDPIGVFAPLADYDLASSIGPVTSRFTTFLNPTIDTTAGTLIFGVADFPAMFRASVQAVPEPSSLAPAACGAFALGGVVIRRRRA